MNNFPEEHVAKASQDKKKEAQNMLVVNYLTLRNLIGWCGILLPVLLWVVWHENNCYHSFEPSISDYYYTRGGDVFVIILSALGLFLFTYNGYDLLEKILLKTAAVCAILVPLIPTDPKCNEVNTPCHADCLLPIHNIGYRGFLGCFIGPVTHLVLAAIFLFFLALISIIYFPKTNDTELLKIAGKRTQKGKRNVVYKVCGVVIIVCLVILAILMLLGHFGHQNVLPGVPYIFIFETISVWAFGLSWITKGETLWPDKK